MTSTYRGLTRWQWAIVALLAIANAVTSATSAAAFVGALLVSIAVMYTVVRLIAFASRGVRSGGAGEEPAS